MIGFGGELRSFGGNTTAQATPAVAPTSPTQGAPGLFGYSNLPQGFGFSSYRAPVTGDTVYLGSIGSGSYAGQKVYVGPDNQPWVGPASAFYTNGSDVNPIIGSAQPVSWASLGVNNADSNVYASGYNGPGATPLQDVVTYETDLPKNENLVVAPNATIASGAGGTVAPGTYPTGSPLPFGSFTPFGNQSGPPAIPNFPGSLGLTGAGGAASGIPAPPNLATAFNGTGAGPTKQRRPRTPIAPKPGSKKVTHIREGHTGGSATAGRYATGGGAPPSITLPAAPTGGAPAATTSSASSVLPLVLLAAVGIGGYFLWKHFHHGTGGKIKPPHPSD